jgi:serine/threonine protein kinase
VEGTPFGRYRLVSLLGRGGMGEVWKAFDTAMNRVVALKVLPPNFADDEQYQVRFRREAQAAAGLDEPHVVPIHDFGEIDGRLYVTMRLIDGKTIDDLLAGGPMSPQRAVSIVEQIAAALGAAHRVGLVHRDVKPSNILVTDDDFAYLIDFGIARAAEGTKLTSTGATIGTLAYMAPERFTSDRCDARVDIYALTCVLHECLTGAQPFPGDSLERQLAGHLTLPPPRPSTMQPGVSAQMDQVIATGMAKNPDQRYATTKDLAIGARSALVKPIAPDPQVATAKWAAPAPSWPAPLPYPDTGPNAPTAGAPTPSHHVADQPAAWSPMPGPPVPQWQQAPSGDPWWRGPAILIPIALVAVAVAVVIAIWPDNSSKDVPVASPEPSAQDRPPGASSRAPASDTAAPGGTSSAATPTSSAPQGPTQLQTADGLSGLLASMRTKFGDTMGYRLVVYPDYAITDRADPKNSHVKQGYMYRGGNWTSWAPALSTTPFDHLADLSAINVAAVAATLAGSAQPVGAPEGTSAYMIIEGADGGGLELAIHSTAPGTGFMNVSADGTVSQVHPP